MKEDIDIRMFSLPATTMLYSLATLLFAALVREILVLDTRADFRPSRGLIIQISMINISECLNVFD